MPLSQLQVPRGPVIEFVALPHPLPEQCQKRLQELAKKALAPEAFEAAWAELDRNLRDFFGVPYARHRFMPGQDW